MNRENLERKEGAAGCFPIVLASASPRRRELLSQIGLAFEVDKSDAQECPHSVVPEEIVRELSFAKAQEVFQRRRQGREGLLVIGADTLVFLDGQPMGKPKDEEDACRMLRLLSGKTHEVYTGVYIQGAKENFLFHEKTEVTFFELTDEEIEAYVRTGEPMDKAGAYGIQGKGALFVERINGDYLNVVGLPLAKTVKYLKEVL